MLYYEILGQHLQKIHFICESEHNSGETEK